MDREEVLSILRRHVDELRRQGVITLSLFGSIARGDAREGSDIDLLVELEPPYTFDRYIQAKFYLEDLLGYPVDLAMTGTLRPRVKEEVDRGAILVT
jgi:predicted nucleotidyltransferase